MIKAFSICTVALAMTTGAGIGTAGAGTLNSGEIRAELIGRSIGWWEESGWFQGYLMFSPDGSAEISVDEPEVSGDHGRWFIRDDRLCTMWGEIRSGAAKCYTIERGSDGRFVTSGGNVFEIREAGI